jgi:DNA methylase
MLADALLDPSSRGDIVIDPFLGSGSTLIAADKIGHVSRGVDLDSLYVVIIRQYAAATGNPAVLIETGEAFDALARVGQGRQRRTRAEFQRRALGTMKP